MHIITNFPVRLQPIIQQGFLEREFQAAMNSRFIFRPCAAQIDTKVPLSQVGRHEDGTAAGEFQVNHYAATTDLSMVTSRVGIASQFLQNAYINGEQAARSLDELARMALRKGFQADRTAVMWPKECERENDFKLTDVLTKSALMNAVTQLRLAHAPTIDGAYNCYLDPISARQLFADPDFKQLFHGATSANQVFRKGMTNDFLGLRFMPTSEVDVRVHPTLTNLMIRKVTICGANAIVQANFLGMTDADHMPCDAIVTLVDGVACVTREPVDRLNQIIAQSWYWMGGFAPMMESDGKFRRAVCIEHVG